MPLRNGRKENWWNWSARDLATGVTKTFFCITLPCVCTKDQLFAHLKKSLPYKLDFGTFSCELTEKFTPMKTGLIPLQYRMNDWQLWSTRRLTEKKHDAALFTKPGLALQKIERPRSIFYGTETH